MVFEHGTSGLGIQHLNHQAKENMCEAKEELKEIYKYQIDPGYVNDGLMGIRSKLLSLKAGRKGIKSE